MKTQHHLSTVKQVLLYTLEKSFIQETRKLIENEIVDKLCHLGLSIRSNRLLNVLIFMGYTAVEQFERETRLCIPIN